jgi:hypothetical protein
VDKTLQAILSDNDRFGGVLEEKYSPDQLLYRAIKAFTDRMAD